MQSTEQVSCRSCGKTGDNLLRCGACKLVWYCDQVCQRRNWKRHKKNCRRQTESEKPANNPQHVPLMDPGQTSSANSCGSCDKIGTNLQRCGRCKSVWYCHQKCQEEDWENHRNKCTIGLMLQAAYDLKSNEENNLGQTKTVKFQGRSEFHSGQDKIVTVHSTVNKLQWITFGDDHILLKPQKSRVEDKRGEWG